MNIKLLIGLVCTAAIGSNAFALQITKGKLISHKEWATDGAVASYLLGTKSNIKMELSQRGLAKTGIEIVAETASTTATVGQPVTINNDASIWIYNSSEEVKQYRYTFHICGNVAADTTECVYTEDVVELEPQGMVSSAKKPTLQLTFDKPGVYDVRAGSWFTTWPRQTQITSSSSAGTITVS